MRFYSQKFPTTWTSWTIPLYKNLTICASFVTIFIVATVVCFFGSINCTNIPAWHFVYLFCLFLTWFVLFYFSSIWKYKKPSRLMICSASSFVGGDNLCKDDFLGDFSVLGDFIFSFFLFILFIVADLSPFLISYSILDRYGFYLLEHTRLYSLIMNPTGSKMPDYF